MGKLALLVVIGAAGLGGWAFMGNKKHSEAFLAYEKFSDAMLENRHNDAGKLAVGQGALDAVEAGKVMHARYGAMMGEVSYAARTVESETASADGKQITLTVSVDCRRGGAPAGPPNVRYKHIVVMVQTDQGWMVDSFQEESTPLTKSE